jgi:uncharacterized protein (DUF2147 family)
MIDAKTGMSTKNTTSGQQIISTSLSVLLIGFLIGLLFNITPIGNVVEAGTLNSEGKWKTISDVTGKPNSIVRICKEKDRLFGKVEVVIPQEGEDPNPLCHKCSGLSKDRPITGMTILWNLTQNEDTWDGGFILDPDNGKTYRCVIRVREDARS